MVVNVGRKRTARPSRRSVAAVKPSPLDPRRAHLRFGPVLIEAALGKGAISAFKREGDGATPLGDLAVVSGFRRGGSLTAAPSAVPLRRVGRLDGWCDAPDHGAYNRPVRLPFPASHETLLRSDRLYDFVLVLDWNIRSRRRGRGSAIFLHVARPGYQPTEGCIALKRQDLIRLLPYLRKGTVFRVSRY
jgi:L,D-peptidoglycan transpeptidase YkuD (ErfK/YbiS/YcfS/YnhG family)